jgi:hypothetical protein
MKKLAIYPRNVQRDRKKTWTLSSAKVRNNNLHRRFEVLTAMKMLMLVLWVVMLCGLVGTTVCLHLQP